MRHFILMCAAAMLLADTTASAKEVVINPEVINTSIINREIVIPVNGNYFVLATESEWIEVQSVVIPFNTELHEGVTKSNNPKYWFEFEGIGKVSVSASNAIKFKERSTTLMLIKWFNQSSNKYRYTTRQKGGSSVRKEIPDIDISNLFK